MGLIFKDGAPKQVSPKAARTRVMLLCIPFALMGLFALVLLAHDGLLGGLNRQKAMSLLSAAIVCGGLIALIFGINAKKMAIQAQGSQAADDRPLWLRRPEWQGGHISNSSRKAVLLVWILVVFWCGVLTVLSLLVLPPLLHRSHAAGLIVLILPVLALAVLIFTLRTTSAWKRFGQSIFDLEQFPAAAGGTLSGNITIPARLQPEHGWHLRLSCIRRQTTGRTNNRQTIDKVLWREEKWLRADLPQMESAQTRLPVFFKLPADLPDASALPGDGVHWKLEASATLRGPNFLGTFEVPVFKLAEPPEPVEDQARAHVISLEHLRESIQSGIEVLDLPQGGREFIFPAGRNPGFAGGATFVCVIWTGIVALLLLKGAPLPFVLIFSVMDLLMLAFVLDLWFRCSRVVVSPEGVLAGKSWFGFKQQTKIPRSQVSSILADIGATAGHALYYDLKAHGPGGKEIVLAKNLKHRPEADWLAGQMTAALVPQQVKA